MNNPTLTYNSETVHLPMPSDWSVEPMIGENTKTSLGGEDFTDIRYRKYRFILEWDAISTSDYDDLEDLINEALDDAESINFIFDKFPQSENPGITVQGRLSTRNRRGGSGQTGYYSKVTLTLTEVEAR